MIDSIVFTPEQEQDGRFVGSPWEVIAPFDFTVGSYVLPQVDSLIPSSENFRYTEAQLRPNTDSVQQLELDFAAFQLGITPFTGLRGGLVANSDSLRHNLTVNFRENTIDECVSLIIDLPVPPEVNLRFMDNEVSFANDRACFVLQPGAGLTVAEGSTLHYGRAGVGLLAARQNARLVVEEDASLILGNPLQLAHQSNGVTQTTVDLQPGSRLVFGEEAGLYRGPEADAAYLTVLMNGGEIDVRHLTPTERLLIRYIYPPETTTPAGKELYLFPNPTARDRVSIRWPEGVAGTVDVTLVDPTGRRVIQAPLEITGPVSRLSLPTDLRAGLYRLLVTGAGNRLGGNLIISR